MSGPFDIQVVIDRLAAQVPHFRMVESAVNLAAFQDANVKPPAAFVLLGTEQGGPRQGGSGIYRQRVTATIGVAIAVQAYGQEAGAAGNDELADLIRRTRAALLNWLPTGAETVIEFVTGQSLGLTNDALSIWLERYRCDYWISNNSPNT